MAKDQPDLNGPTSLLRELRSTDADTGLLTRASLYQGLLREIARSERYGNRLSLLRIKLLALPGGNETERGKLLLELASRILDNVRTIDYAGRWSDDEFLIILPETNHGGAQLVAEKIQGVTGATSVDTGHTEGTPRVDIRVAVWQPGDDASGLLDKVQR